MMPPSRGLHEISSFLSLQLQPLSLAFSVLVSILASSSVNFFDPLSVIHSCCRPVGLQSLYYFPFSWLDQHITLE